MRHTIKRRKLTPPQVAVMLGTGTDKVTGWIRSGELRAINIATNPNGRPRWAIDVDDLAAFEQQRAAIPPAPKATRSKRQSSGKQYF